MKNVLILGSTNIMIYIQQLKSICEITTFKSSTQKCNMYELNQLDKINVNNANIIIILDNLMIYFLNGLISMDTNIHDIFCLSQLSLINDKILVHNTIKIKNVVNIIEPKNIKLKKQQKMNITSLSNINKITPNKITPNKKNYLLQFSNICLEMLNKLEEVQCKKIAKDSKLEAVYIEFRNLPHSEAIIKNCIIKLDEKWSHTVVCGNDNYAQIIEICDKINKDIKIIKLDKSNVSYNDYNNLLLSSDFWNMLVGEKILIYQSDSFIFKSNIDDFLPYDYIGAPFNKDNKMILAKEQVGNGGLSLRSKSVMLSVLNNKDSYEAKYSNMVQGYKSNNKLDNIPEDIFFSQNMQNLNLGVVADYDTAKRFSIDTIYYENSFGMHCMWHSCKNWEEELMGKSTFKQISQYKTKNISNTNTKTILDVSYLTHMDEYCNIMNVTKEHVLNNFKEEFRYFCFRYLDYMRQIELPIIAQNGLYEAVLIEYRCLPHLEFLIRNAISKLGNEWSYTVICGNLNYEYMKDVVKSIGRNIKVIRTDYDNLNQSTYSLFLASVDFWNLLVGEKILIYQEDSCIFKTNINDFIEWDYIGAPWNKHQNDSPNGVGNGGLSLRTKSCMLEVIKRIGINETTYNSSTIDFMINCKMVVPPEDVYFSKNMQELGIGRVADWDSAFDFSSESIINENSFGGHGVWCRDSELMKKMMYDNIVQQKICAISSPYGLNIGGGENYLLCVAKFFIRYKKCIIYLFINQDKPTKINTIAEFLGKEYLSYFCFFRFEDASFFNGKVDYHFLMNNNKYPYLNGLSPNRNNNIYHCQFPFDTTNLITKLEREKMVTFKNIIVNSDFSKKYYTKFTKGIVDPNDVIVLYPSCFKNVFTFNNYKKTKNSFVMIGRIFNYCPNANNKNFEIALKLFNQLSQNKYLNFELNIIGKVYSTEMLKKLKSFNMPQVNFYTDVSNDVKISILKKSKYIINMVGLNRNKEKECYAYEHFGISMIEGINYECIPITVDGGYPYEYVKQDNNKLYFANENEFLNIITSIIVQNTNYEFDLNYYSEIINKFSESHFEKTLTSIMDLNSNN